MIARCEFKLTPRRTCGVELHGIYRYCPEHMRRPDEPSDETSEIAQEYVDYYAGVADEVEDT